MKQVLVFLIVLSVIFNSCEDNDLVPQQVKLDYYTESYDIDNLGFTPQIKVQYEYTASGSLSKYAVWSYDPSFEALVEQRHFMFTYKSNGVDKIEGYLPNTTEPYVVYLYEYTNNNKVSRIRENNMGANTSSQATFNYAANDTIQVNYAYSNGSSFSYQFFFGAANINHDKTTRGLQLCSSGSYTYDNHPNPFNTLGYTDYLLLNLSANNKLTESVNYVACSFPSLAPESYVYEYNTLGYPTKVTTIYKSGGSTPATSVREYFYKEM